MRPLLFILAAIALSVFAATLIWRPLLDPTLPPLPPMPSQRQRQFTTWITPMTSAQLERKLPDDFKPPAGFEAMLTAIGRQVHVRPIFNWRMIEEAGGRRDAPTKVQVAGMRAGDAIVAVLAAQSPPLAAVADDDDMAMTITTVEQAAKTNQRTVTYPVTDLATTPAEQQALLTQVQAAVAPSAWSTADPAGGARIRPMLGGTLVVTVGAPIQYDVAAYLNSVRYHRSRVEFAKRAGALTGSAVTLVSLALLLRAISARRRRRLAGCCRKCGYDLRASAHRCPECGEAIPETEDLFYASS